MYFKKSHCVYPLKSKKCLKHALHNFSLSINFFIFSCSTERHRETETDWQIKFPSTESLPNAPNSQDWVGPRPAAWSSGKLSPVRGGHPALNHHWLPPRVYTCRKLELRTEPRHSSVRQGILTGILSPA